jgi:hypothetical protein
MEYNYALISVNFQTGESAVEQVDSNPRVVAAALYGRLREKNPASEFGLVRFKGEKFSSAHGHQLCSANFVNIEARAALRQAQNIPKRKPASKIVYNHHGTSDLLRYGMYSQVSPITYSARLVEVVDNKSLPWSDRPTPAEKSIQAASLGDLAALASDMSNWPYKGHRKTRIASISYRRGFLEPRPLPPQLCGALIKRLGSGKGRILN